jgi:protein-tyrosine phosphatase
MPSVLFVCRANQFRSPLAAAFLLRQIGSDQRSQRWSVGSAGTWTKAGLPAASVAMRIADRLNLPGLVDHRTRQVDMELLESYDLILTMEIGQHEAIASEFPILDGRSMLLSEVVDGMPYDIPDPVDFINDPEDVASELQMLIEKGGDKIIKLAESIYQARHIPHGDVP